MDKRTRQQIPQKKDRKMFILLGVVLCIAIIAWLGLKWYGQIQEYKDNIILRDQRIDDLQQHLYKLQGANTDNPGSAKTLQLTEWEVEIPLEDSSSGFSATLDNGYYYISSKLAGCWSDGKDLQQPTSVNAGAIGRYKSSERIPVEGVMGDRSWAGRTWREFHESLADTDYNSTVTIGDYIYNVRGPQQGCGNPDTEAGKSANEVHAKLTKELIILFKSLHSATVQN